MSEDSPEEGEDALAGQSAGQCRGGAVARERYFLHGGKMGPEPHIGEITAPYPARPKNKSGT